MSQTYTPPFEIAKPDLGGRGGYAVLAIDWEDPKRGFHVVAVTDSEIDAEIGVCYCYIEDALEEAQREAEEEVVIRPMDFYEWLSEVVGRDGGYYDVVSANIATA